MTELSAEDINFAKRLRQHPELRHCFEEMLDTAELNNNTIETADDAEECIVAQVRKTGAAALKLWAQNAHDKCCKDVDGEQKTRPHQKKVSNGTHHSEPSRSRNRDS